MPAPNPYYLSPAALAELKRRAAAIRAELALRRAFRQAQDAAAQTRRPLP